MKKTDSYYAALYKFAHKKSGSYVKLARVLGDVRGPAVQAWAKNGVAHKWRPVLEKEFGRDFRKHLKELVS